ncbi:MAG: hypothetical protein V7K21_01740 [Nostoc sp.]
MNRTITTRRILPGDVYDGLRQRAASRREDAKTPNKSANNS